MIIFSHSTSKYVSVLISLKYIRICIPTYERKYIDSIMYTQITYSHI